VTAVFLLLRACLASRGTPTVTLQPRKVTAADTLAAVTVLPMGIKGTRMQLTAVVLAALMAAALTSCGSDSDDQNEAAEGPTTTENGVRSPEARPGEDPESDDRTTTQAPVAPGDIPNATAEPAGTDVSYLRDVRVGRQDGKDRVTFEFDGARPGYDIGYATMPPRQDGSGQEVPVDGSAGLAVRFSNASSVNLTGGVSRTYSGPERLGSGEAQNIAEVVSVSDFESQLVWAIGVQDRANFEVIELPDPTRIVIDIG
jgi:hypothetical protein